MELVVRTVTRPELDKAVEVEEKAMKGSGYLRDVSELFLSDEVGPLLGAYKDGEELVGIAKYTVLADHTAWLETLRVAPEYQRQGVGRRSMRSSRSSPGRRAWSAMANVYRPGRISPAIRWHGYSAWILPDATGNISWIWLVWKCPPMPVILDPWARTKLWSCSWLSRRSTRAL